MNQIVGSGLRDPRVRSYINPARVVWTSPGGVTRADALISGIEDACIMQREKGTDPPAILLDFGVELHGGVRIHSPINNSGKPVRFRVRFGESVSEAMNEPNNDHAVHDHEILVPWMGYTEVGCTGFRFVRLDLLDYNTTITLNSVKAVAIYHDLDYIGSFECSDERLNEIWKVGARTVHLCMQDYLWDGIKRDRLVWIGDIHPETRVVSTVFGRSDIVEKSLDFARDKYALPGWMNGISSYSIWWIIAHLDWYRYHGDLRYLEQQKDYLLRLLGKLMQCVADNGCEKLDGHRFLDWPTSTDPDAVSSGLQALMALGLKAGAQLALALSEDDIAARANNIADLASKANPAATMRKQPSAIISLAEMADPQVINDSILSVDPFAGMSTFYGYYVLEARAKAGDYQGCLELIRNYWGAMLDLGATTFWEDFDLEWAINAGRIDEIVAPGKRDIHKECGDHCYKGLRHSFCHGWAAGPTAWLTEHVLGVAPVSPGFKVTSIDPHLADLRWARGTVPTPFGIIEVRHEVQDNGAIKTDVAAPDGVKISDLNSKF